MERQPAKRRRIERASPYLEEIAARTPPYRCPGVRLIRPPAGLLALGSSGASRLPAACAAVASCEDRPRLQRRARDGFRPSSLFTGTVPDRRGHSVYARRVASGDRAPTDTHRRPGRRVCQDAAGGSVGIAGQPALLQKVAGLAASDGQRPSRADQRCPPRLDQIRRLQPNSRSVIQLHRTWRCV